MQRIRITRTVVTQFPAWLTQPEQADKPLYTISVAARLADMPVRAIRACEQAGLLAPSRAGGRQRLYSQEDVERLQRIRTLIYDMGVNMAGVEVALKLMDRIEELELEVRRLRPERA
jgi:MerR family transcriptional regulator/heat shock protein HspR